jgi:predicted metal-binding membrane protein
VTGAGEAGLERLLRRDRTITAAGLAVLCALAWLYVVSGAGLGHSARDMTALSLFPHKAAAPMAGMSMPGMEMPGMEMSGMAMPAGDWSPGRWALTVAMWWTMMVAMMAPSAAPTVLLYARVHRHASGQGRAEGLAPTPAFLTGYLLVWLGFSLAAAALQWSLERSGLVSASTLGSQSRWLSAAVLIGAGLYQLSPLQKVCLAHCRAPASFLSRHWRPKTAGAVRLGVLHGAYCVGCCWMLMTLLFVGGVMNLAWIGALTVLVLAEKVLPGGRWVAWAGAVVLLVWGVATLAV